MCGAGGELDALSELPTAEVAVDADLQILFVRLLADQALIKLPLDIKCAQGCMVEGSQATGLICMNWLAAQPGSA